MKTILERIREQKINECGGCSGYWTGCYGSTWRTYEQDRKDREREARKEAEKVDPKIREEYKKLLSSYNRKVSSSWSTNSNIYNLEEEFRDLKHKSMGINRVVNDIYRKIHEKTSMYRTFTITVDTLKLIAHIIGEEMEESKMVDDKLSDALKKIKDIL